MHSNPMFRADAGALLARAAAIGFAHIFIATASRPMVAHVPVTLHDGDGDGGAGAELRFHVSRANAVHAHLADATVLASIAGPDGYVSPNWYARPGNQVLSWNYETIEVVGTLRPLTDAELLDQIDTLARTHEPTWQWKRAKTDPAVIAGLLRAIEGYALVPDSIRGTRKLSQNKGAANLAGIVAGLRTAGNDALAEAMA